MYYNLWERIKLSQQIIPQNVSAGNITGVSIDRVNVLEAVIAMDLGAVSGAPASLSVKTSVFHSDDGITFADAGVDYQIDHTSANSLTKSRLDCRGLKRYIRVDADVTFVGGAAPTIDLAGTLIMESENPIPAE